jgi:hypothetical protein
MAWLKLLPLLWSPVGAIVGSCLIIAAGIAWLRWDAGDRAVEKYKDRLEQVDIDRTEDATKADDDARRCARDDTCWMRNDGWRRD